MARAGENPKARKRVHTGSSRKTKKNEISLSRGEEGGARKELAGPGHPNAGAKQAEKVGRR